MQGMVAKKCVKRRNNSVCAKAAPTTPGGAENKGKRPGRAKADLLRVKAMLRRNDLQVGVSVSATFTGETENRGGWKETVVVKTQP